MRVRVTYIRHGHEESTEKTWETETPDWVALGEELDHFDDFDPTGWSTIKKVEVL